MLRKLIPLTLLTITSIGHADTIGRYMNIANNIPKMEMKADKQAHTWARSARTILSLTSESIAETLMLTNQAASEHGTPLFCMPAGISLNALMLNELIQQTYREISSQESDKNNMTVSQVALIGVARKYPCAGSNVKPSDVIRHEPVTPISHVDGVILPPPPDTTATPD
ncbi:MAG: phosphatase [Legionellaceae bacterium]|nr:phosphatase [Legionellaceae bacterium]